MIKAAVIGAGYIAREHLDCLRKLKRVETAAICDLSPVMAEATADEFRVPRWFTDHRRMLAEIEPDVGVVPCSGETTVEPLSSVRYTLRAHGPEAEAAATGMELVPTEMVAVSTAWSPFVSVTMQAAPKTPPVV